MSMWCYGVGPEVLLIWRYSPDSEMFTGERMGNKEGTHRPLKPARLNRIVGPDLKEVSLCKGNQFREFR